MGWPRFHSGARWTEKFKHVVGVVHTNYLEYAKREEGGGAKEVFMRHVNSLMCRFHCHKARDTPASPSFVPSLARPDGGLVLTLARTSQVVKLSGAVQDLPKSMTEFVHGVSPQCAPALSSRFAVGRVNWDHPTGPASTG